MKIQRKIGGGGVRGEGEGWGVRVDVNEELKFFVKIKKTIWGGGGRGGGGWVGEGGRVGGGQDGCERKIEVFVKIQRKIIFFRGEAGGGAGSG